MQQAFQDLRDLLGWAPDRVVAVAILVLAVLVGFVLHAIAFAMARRVLPRRRTYLLAFLDRSKNLTRVAVLLIMVALALPAAPLGATTAPALEQLLLVAFIALTGSTALMALDISSEFYLRRFRLDTSDNLLARKHITQVRVLQRTIDTLIIMVTVGAALMTFESVRQYGVSLFASAGVAGLIVGLAARPVLSNLFAGIQLAIAQPIRLDDVVVAENEWGRVEEITATYVVLRLWDLRRLVVPLSYFIEKPFQNWTRESSGILGSVVLYLDFAAPLDAIRAKAKEIAEQSPAWDGKVLNVQVTDARETSMEVRILVGANSAFAVGDLRALMREKMIAFLQRDYPAAWPQQRQMAPDTEQDRGKPNRGPAALPRPDPQAPPSPSG